MTTPKESQDCAGGPQRLPGGQGPAPENRKSPSPEEALRLIHELRVHQVELKMQNDELLRVQAELDATRARYFDLNNLAPVGYFIVSHEGRILETNLTGVNLLGAARAALVNQPINQFIFKEDQDVYYLHSSWRRVRRTRASCGW